MRKGMKKRKRSNIWNRIRAGMLAAVLTATMQTGILAAEQIEEVDRKQAEVQIQLWERSSGAETRSIEVSVMVKVEEDKQKEIVGIQTGIAEISYQVIQDGETAHPLQTGILYQAEATEYGEQFLQESEAEEMEIDGEVEESEVEEIETDGEVEESEIEKTKTDGKVEREEYETNDEMDIRQMEKSKIEDKVEMEKQKESKIEEQVEIEAETERLEIDREKGIESVESETVLQEPYIWEWNGAITMEVEQDSNHQIEVLVTAKDFAGEEWTASLFWDSPYVMMEQSTEEQQEQEIAVLPEEEPTVCSEAESEESTVCSETESKEPIVFLETESETLPSDSASVIQIEPILPELITQEWSQASESVIQVPLVVPEPVVQIPLVKPVIVVTYDHNDGANGNYYKTDRMATISIVSVSFDSRNVKIVGTATENGRVKDVPVVSDWIKVGDVYMATIHYTEDGLYTLEISYQDQEGMMAESVVAEPFYIDRTKPEVMVTDIVDHSVNSTKDEIGFVITATDQNFDTFVPQLTAVVLEGGQFVKKTIETGELVDIENGQQFVVENLDLDGIYHLSCTISDKAGNTFEEILLYDMGEDAYTKSIDKSAELVTFSVIRGGSLFELGTFAAELAERYYVQRVLQDIEIREINTDALGDCQVMVNGKVLQEGRDYTIRQEQKEGQWNICTYLISRELFDAEGEYRVVVSSKDQAEHKAFSDMRESSLVFVVDRTAPVVTVSGICSGGIYHTREQRVTLIPSDDGGALRSVLVQTVDEMGEMGDTLLALSGEKLRDRLEVDEKLEFVLGEGAHQNIQIICQDETADENGNANFCKTIISDVTVSESWWSRFLEQNIFGKSSIGIGLLLLVSVASYVIYKKKNLYS